MSKLLHLWQRLSDANIVRLRNESISLEGVRKIVSNDESLLLSLACAELAESLSHAAKSVSRLSQRCTNSSLRSFERLFDEFADLGRDPNGWVMNCKEIEAKNEKMDRYMNITTTLYKEMEELTALETELKKSTLKLIDSEYDYSMEPKAMNLQQKLQWKKQQIKYLKERSLWNKTHDVVVSMLARSVFTILARIKFVFGVGQGYAGPTSLPRSLSSSSSSAMVYPSSDHCQNQSSRVISLTVSVHYDQTVIATQTGFLESISKLRNSPETILGASALALNYANLIIVMDKMIKQPQLVGLDARDDIYAMLPCCVRSSLRSRLRGVGFAATDPGLAAEWKTALGRILGWLLPLAHNLIKWQSERSFEQQKMVAKTNNVLLLQTLFFASREKTEAA